MPHLRPCPQCSRHVRADEARCPFCERAIGVDERAPLAPSGRLGRAALMAFGAAVATASLAGCNKDKGEEPAIEAEQSAATAKPDTEARPTPREQDKRDPQGSAIRDDSAKDNSEPVKSPFLVGAEPPPTPPTNNDSARPPDSGRQVPPVNTVKPPTTSTWNQNRWNHAKPYGAPPADGLPEIV